MNRIASVFGLVVLVAAGVACTSESASDVGETSGAQAQGTRTRCGPPKAPAAIEQARCISLGEVKTSASTRIEVTNVENDPSKYTFRMTVDIGSNESLIFLFADRAYDSRSDAEKGVGALLRGALKASNYELVPDGDKFYLQIKSGGQVVAETARFETNDAAEVVLAVQRALDGAEIDLTSESRARWSVVRAMDGGPSTFALIAGNGKRILYGASFRSMQDLENNLFLAHDLGAADYSAAETVAVRPFCDSLLGSPDGTGPIGKSIIVSWNDGAGGPENNYTFSVVDSSGKSLAGVGQGSATCEGIIEKIRTVTRTLNAMPRG